MNLHINTIYTGNLTWLHERTILLTRHGSHAYGLARASSDLDLKGVAIPPSAYFTGFLNRFEQAETSAPYDLVIYAIRKFFKLASDCNPNIIEVLWTDPSDHLLMTQLGQRLVDHRHAFLSQKVKHTFSGYAMAQLKRIKTHRRWLLDPPSAPPTRAAHDLPEVPEVSKDQMMAALDMVNKKLDGWGVDLEPFRRPDRLHLRELWAKLLAEMSLTDDRQWQAAARSLGFEENFLQLLDRERLYRAEAKRWKQYTDWKKSRNKARAALEEKFSFDVKHGMHLVRLMRMCREILETGEVQVKRPDREELLAIRDGAWSFEELITWAEEEDKALDAIKRASPLPNAPDRKALDALCQDLVDEALSPRCDWTHIVKRPLD